MDWCFGLYISPMQKLEDISKKNATPRQTLQTGNALPVFWEIRHALALFLSAGKTSVIDLEAVPFGPGDKEQLLRWLGEGEVTAELNALGRSRVWESRFPGIWVIDHYNPQEERMTLQVEITDIPELLRSQHEDLEGSLERLDKALNSLTNGEAES